MIYQHKMSDYGRYGKRIEEFKANLKPGDFHIFSSELCYGKDKIKLFMDQVGLTKVVYRSPYTYNAWHNERTGPGTYLVICQS